MRKVVFTWTDTETDKTAVMAKRQERLLSMFSRVKDTDEDGSDYEENNKERRVTFLWMLFSLLQGREILRC